MGARSALLALLAILLVLPPVVCQPQELRVKNIGAKILEFEIFSPVNQTYSVDIWVLNLNNTVIYRETKLVSGRVAIGKINLMGYPPGYYILRIVLYEGDKQYLFSRQIVLSPTDDDFAALLSGIAVLISDIETYRIPRADINASLEIHYAREYFRKALLASLEGRWEEALVYYLKSREKVEEIRLYFRERIYPREPLALLLEELEEYLYFDSRLVFQFWINILATALFLPVLFVFLAPLFISSPYRWVENVTTLIEVSDYFREKVKEDVHRRLESMLTIGGELVDTTYRTFAMAFISTFIATLGLLADNPVVIIGSMLIAPVFSIAAGSSIGMAFREEAVGETRGEDVFYRGVKGELYMILGSIIVAFLTVKAISSVYPVIPGKEILLRSRPNLSDLGVALGAGLAGTLSVAGRKELSGIIGSAIAIALVPPLSVVGIGLAISRPDIALGALSLLFVNVISIKLGGVITAKLYTLAPLFTSVLELASVRRIDVFEILKDSFSLWLSLILDISLIRAKADHRYYIKHASKTIFKYAVCPILIVEVFGLLVSTDISSLSAEAIRLVAQPLTDFLNLLPWFIETSLFYLSLLLLIELSLRLIRQRAKSFRTRVLFLVHSAIFWLIFSSYTSIYLYPRANIVILATYIPLVILVFKWRVLRRDWAKIFIGGFAIFSLIFMVLQSTVIYQYMVRTEELSSAIKIVKYATSTFFDVPLRDVEAHLTAERIPRLRVSIAVPLKNIEIVKTLSSKLDILVRTLRKLGGKNLEIEILLKLLP